MLLQYLRYRYIKHHLNAYLDGDLPAHKRRFIARYIDQDAKSYRAFVRLRQSRQQLEQDLPLIGQANDEQLARMWDHIQADVIQTPLSQPEEPQQHYRIKRWLRYSITLIVIVFALASPLIVNSDSLTTLPVAQQPVPQEITALLIPTTVTPQGAEWLSSTVPETPMSLTVSIPLKNTPEVRTPGS